MLACYRSRYLCVRQHSDNNCIYAFNDSKYVYAFSDDMLGCRPDLL